jgi:hypothetical protein
VRALFQKDGLPSVVWQAGQIAVVAKVKELLALNTTSAPATQILPGFMTLSYCIRRICGCFYLRKMLVTNNQPPRCFSQAVLRSKTATSD